MQYSAHSTTFPDHVSIQVTNTRPVIEIRRAQVSDVHAISEVCAEGWRDTYREILPLREIEDTIARNYDPDRIATDIEPRNRWRGWFVGLMDGQIVGAGSAGISTPRTCELFMLYVKPDRRYLGVGTRLLEAITRDLLEHGAVRQLVSVHPENKKGLPFYRSRGFVDHGKREGVGAFANSYLLKRRIAVG